MAKKKKKGFADIVRSLAPKNEKEARAIVTRSERQGPSQAQIKAEQARKKAAENLRSEIKRSNNLSQVRSAALRATENAASNMKAARAKGLQASKSVSDGTKAIKAMQDTYQMSTNRKRALAGQGAGRPLIIGNSAYAGWQTSENDRIRRRTQSDKEYAKKVDAGLNLTGLTPTKLTAGLPTDEEKKYRKDYGFDKQAKQIIENRYKNTPGAAGFIDAWRTESVEKSMEEQYGKNNLDMDLIDKTRGSGRYVVGNVAGQLSQFAMTAPVAGAMEGAALTRAGINAARTGKAFRGAKTTRDALKIAGIRSGVQSLAATPVNLLDALKENNAKDVLKRFGMNQGLDLVFGGLSEIPMLRRNIHYANAFNLNNAANRAATRSEKDALKKAAQRELEKVDKKTLEAAQAELRQADNAIDELRRSGFGRYGRTTGQQIDDVTAAARDGFANRQISTNLDGLSDGTTSRTARETAERATTRNAAEQAAERQARNVAEEATEQNTARTARNAASEAEQRQVANDTTEAANQAWDDIPNAVDNAETRAAGDIDSLRQRIIDQNPERVSDQGRRPLSDIVPEEYQELAERSERTTEAMDQARKQFGEYKNNYTPKGVQAGDEVRRVTKTYDTIKENLSPWLQDINDEHTFIFKRGMSYSKGKSVDELVEDAAKALDENPEQYVSKLLSDPKVSRLSKPERLVGLDAAQTYYKQAGNVEMEGLVAQEYIRTVHEAGQELRIHAILQKTSRPARLHALDKSEEAIIQGVEKRLRRLGIDPDSIRVSPEARQAIYDADTEEEQAEAWYKASVELWDQIPPSVQEKLDFWRMNAMLLNPKTHVRNLVGNAIFAPIREIKNVIGSGIEAGFERVNLLQNEGRQKALLVGGETGRNLKYSSSVYQEYINPLMQHMDKVGSSQGLSRTRPVGGKVLSAGPESSNPIVRGFRRGMDKIGAAGTKGLNYEDILFSKPAFEVQMARIMKARGLSPDDLVNNKELRESVIETSMEEALRATYRDESWLSTQLRRAQSIDPDAPILAKIGGIGVKADLPFVKTPINIGRRAVDYSPLGFVEAADYFARAIKTGNKTNLVATGIDRLASALTGTGLMGAGYWAAQRGHLTARLSDDRKGKFEKDMGLQNFSLIIGNTDNGHSITLDWASPSAVPFFTGVALQNEMADDNLSLWEIGEAIGSVLSPLTDLTVLQGLDELVKSFDRGYQEGGLASGVMQAGLQTGLNYVGQFKPTVLGTAARIIDPVRRDTTSTAETQTQRTVERWINRQMAGTPGLSQRLQPYIDVRGNAQRNGGALEQLLSPAYFRDINYSSVDREIDSVATATGDQSVYPEKYKKYTVRFDGNDRRMTPEERTNYLRTQGKTTYKELNSLMQSNEYRNATDKDKAEMIKGVYKSAGIAGKQEMLIKAGEDEWKVRTDDLGGKKKPDYQDAKAAGIDAKTYYDLMTTKDWDYDGNGYGTKAEYVRYLNGRDDLTGAQKAIIFGKLSTAKNPYGDGISKASTGSSRGGGRGRRGRSGRRSGGGSKAKRTESGKKFTATHTASDLRSNITPVRISSASAGLSKSQKKALLKLMKKRFEV